MSESTGGFVYQYVGDEIMALFDLVDDTYTDSGVRAARAFQRRNFARLQRRPGKGRVMSR